MKLRKILGIYEIVAGTIGLGLLCWLLLTLSISGGTISIPNQGLTEIMHLVISVLLPPLIFYSLAIIAGILLVRNKRGGKTLSVILHIVQIPTFTIAGISYFVSLGLRLLFMLQTSSNHIYFGFRMFIGPQFHISLGENNGSLLLGVNAGAIVLLILLLRVSNTSPTPIVESPHT